MEVNPAYHPKIIGRRGLVITRIRSDHNVNIQFPDRNDENQSLIKIVGYEKNAEAAKADIDKIVYELVSGFDVFIDINNTKESWLIKTRQNMPFTNFMTFYRIV